LDHILLSDALVEEAEFDIVHVNAKFAEVAERASDHDPLVVGLTIGSTPLLGDFNGDGDVDRRDLRVFARTIGSREGDRRYLATADFNDDGRVDPHDLRFFLSLLK